MYHRIRTFFALGATGSVCIILYTKYITGMRLFYILYFVEHNTNNNNFLRIRLILESSFLHNKPTYQFGFNIYIL